MTENDMRQMPEFKALQDLCSLTKGNPTREQYAEIMRLSGICAEALKVVPQ